MRIEIKGLSELRQRLAQLRPDEIIAKALADQAQRLAEAVQERLSEPQGAGSHDTPWVRTGALRDSISATAEGLQAAVGSNDPAAAPQEMGTSRIPPRPFLAPAAASSGETIAQAVAQQLVAALRGEAPSQTADSGIVATSMTTSSGLTPVQRRTYPHPGGVKVSGLTSPVPSQAARLVGYYTDAIDGSTATALGLSRSGLRDAVHSIKRHSGLRGDDNVIIHIPSGDVLFGDEIIGNLHDE